MNNKGQVLVAAILFIPVILLVLAIVIDIGTLSVTKKQIDTKVENVIKDTIKSMGMDNENLETEIDRLIYKNIGPSTRNVEKTNKLTVKIEKQIKVIFPFLSDTNYKIEYVVHDVNGEIIIMRRWKYGN